MAVIPQYGFWKQSTDKGSEGNLPKELSSRGCLIRQFQLLLLKQKPLITVRREIQQSLIQDSIRPRN